MLFGTVPFKANNMQDLNAMIVKAKFSLKKRKRDKELSKDLKNLIRGLLEPDPSKRLTLDQVKKHPWILTKPTQPVQLMNLDEIQAIRKDFMYKELAGHKKKK